MSKNGEQAAAAIGQMDIPTAPLPSARNPRPAAHTVDLENRFTYHAPKPGQAERYVAIRAKAFELAQLISETGPASAEQTLAIRKVEEAVMWANANIARNE